MRIRNLNAPASGLAVLAVVVVAAALAVPSTDAHHSYAMYDGTVYRVFTGVMVRIVPNAAHFEMHMVPLNAERDALLRREDGEPDVWVLQMESAAQARREGITQEAFPQGTVFSMAIHPRRDGRPAGDRGDSGLFRCPMGEVPAPGRHCDSVEGNTPFGEGVIPADGPVASN